MEKHKHFKFMGFLNISGEAEIHATPKTCGKWVFIVREKCGKTQTFQIYGSLKYFGWHRNPYNSQKMGKMDFHCTGKVRENTRNFKFMGFLNISGEVEIHAIPKTCQKWISIVREKNGKTQTFQIYRFLKYFGWSRNPYNSQNMWKMVSIVREKYAKIQTFQIYGFPKNFGLSRSIKIQKYGKSNSHSKRKIWENTNM